MAKECSFDVVSDFDPQELLNAVDQVRREISSRFDLKDSGSELDIENNSTELVITTTDEFRVRNIIDILENKMSKRGLSTQILDLKPLEDSLGGNVRQKIKLKKGIDKELAKKIVSAVKDTKLKVQASIQGDQVRVVGKDKDELQTIIQTLRQHGDAWSVPLQFTNYR